MKIFKNPFSILVFGAILVTIIITSYGDNGVRLLSQLRLEKRDLDQKINEIQTENEKLYQEIQALNEDYLYIERIAREELGMIRADEFVFIVPE